jgi:hypothetical protein
MVLRVPPYAGECRFVRVISVLIFARAPGLCCFCVGAKAADSQGYLPRSRLVARPPQGARRTGHPACRQGHAGPGQMAVPLPQRGAPAGPPSPGTTRALSKHHHAHLAQPSITAAPRPGADRTTHSNEKRLLRIFKIAQIAESAFWLAAAIAVVIEHRTSSSGRKRR